MEKYFVLLLMISETLQAFSYPDDSTFRQLVCQQCNSGCPTGQGIPHIPVKIGKAGPRGPVGPRGRPGIVNMTAVEEMIDKKIHQAIGYFSLRSCHDVSLERAKSRNETGGVFDIFVPSKLGVTRVYCDVTTDGGNWIVFQRRMDGSVDFNRNWDDYVSGFGEVDKEFWLGLEAIHQLTREGEYELRIDMIEHDGTQYYATYRQFKVGPAWDNYRLTAVGHSGNATNRLNYHNERPFSTKDADHDSHSNNCAITFNAGWWFGSCHNGNLNGLYTALNGWHGVAWYDHRRSKIIHMRHTEMKFRKAH